MVGRVDVEKMGVRRHLSEILRGFRQEQRKQFESIEADGDESKLEIDESSLL